MKKREDLVFSTFYLLQKELGKRPTQQQVADRVGMSRKKVGEYFRKLKLKEN